MISEIIYKRSVVKYIKKYNNRQLRDTYLSIMKKSNKTHFDNLFIKLLRDEMLRRGMLNYGFANSKD